MRVTAVVLVIVSASLNASAAEPTDTYPITIDLDDHLYRQIVVDHETGQYLGHPTTCLLEDGKTMHCVYPKA